ncbi:interferon alpha/beta receptor 2-like isoform X2 [Sparus aurata]|uniref:interferon alpha/beta receptor 2-like isoform X2 n=1 Tax=Sparus aurata TaxID=8175 RepID=UPI0011C132B2|nr:interferon alpha/beta receptor 2-like isoform X2 [Sparus aurata]
MRLVILLLLLLQQMHLGNAPWTEVSVSLPAPSNVSISSFNMEHTLSFLPGADSPDSSRFEVQVVRLSKKSWKAVAACSALTAGQTCNLTRVFKDPLEQFRARVRAFTAGQTSSWTVSSAFHPLSDTVLGPPDVVVSGCGNCLLLRVRPSIWTQQIGLSMDLVINVKRTRDGAQFILTRPYEEEVEIPYLQRGVEYCVTVTVKTLFNDNSGPSDAHCAFTSPPPSHSLSVVYGLLGAFCALLLLLLLIGSFVCSGQLSVRGLRRRLPTTLSYFLLKVQDVGAAPPELSGDTLATLLHKEGSADCLLPDH